MRQDTSAYYKTFTKPFSSKAEMVEHMRDKRYSGGLYERDEAYINMVTARCHVTDEGTLGVGVSAEPGDGTFYQDVDGELAGLTDKYHDTEEGVADMRTAKYKSSAWERERVRQKVERSTPPVESFERTMCVEMEPADGNTELEGNEQ